MSEPATIKLVATDEDGVYRVVPPSAVPLDIHAIRLWPDNERCTVVHSPEGPLVQAMTGKGEGVLRAAAESNEPLPMIAGF